MGGDERQERVRVPVCGLATADKSIIRRPNHAPVAEELDFVSEGSASPGSLAWAVQSMLLRTRWKERRN